MHKDVIFNSYINLQEGSMITLLLTFQLQLARVYFKIGPFKFIVIIYIAGIINEPKTVLKFKASVPV